MGEDISKNQKRFSERPFETTTEIFLDKNTLKRYKPAISYYNNGQYGKAISHFEKVMKESDIEMHPFFGLCYFMNGEEKKALTYWVAYINKKESEPETYSKKGPSKHKVIVNWACVFKTNEDKTEILKTHILNNLTNLILTEDKHFTCTFTHDYKFYHVAENRGISLDKLFDIYKSIEHLTFECYDIPLQTTVFTLANFHFWAMFYLPRLIENYDLKFEKKDKNYYKKELIERFILRLEPFLGLILSDLDSQLELPFNEEDKTIGSEISGFIKERGAFLDSLDAFVDVLSKATPLSLIHGDAHLGNFSSFGFPIDLDDSIIGNPLDDLSMLILSARTHPHNYLSEMEKLKLEEMLLRRYKEEFNKAMSILASDKKDYIGVSKQLTKLIGKNNILTRCYLFPETDELSRLYDHFLIKNALLKTGSHLEFGNRFVKYAKSKYNESLECLRIALSTMEKRSEEPLIRDMKNSLEQFVKYNRLKKLLEEEAEDAEKNPPMWGIYPKFMLDPDLSVLNDRRYKRLKRNSAHKTISK